MLRIQQTNCNFFLKIIILFFILAESSSAEILKPSINIDPKDIVKNIKGQIIKE